MMDSATRNRMRRELDELHRLFDLVPSRREAALHAIDSEDVSLGAAVRKMLEYADEEMRANDESDHSPGHRSGTIISGRFFLLRLLGSGGMGEVYLAQRTDDVDRQVALKVIRRDLPIPVERARRERHILARLAHPNIAAFVDAGVTETREPWFAMEYVDGEAITDWCDQRKLDLRARARLFSKVCRAVQFAHRNLILHRDLKPSNILVNREGVPKLLDFGVAKVLSSTEEVAAQTISMTPEYAAPEQLRGEAATTASDVYQLGLVLFELLTGIPAGRARWSEMRSDGDVPRPDRAVYSLSIRAPASAKDAARARGSDVKKLKRMLRGDLARVVVKATAEDLQSRYDTPQALAEDVDRWVEGLPVNAHRGSVMYRVRKFVRRHIVASCAIAALALALVATSVLALRHAETERMHREQAETLLSFMNEIFAQANPQKTRGASLSAEQLLERAAVHLDERSDLDSTTRAMLKIQIADTFNSLALFDKAVSPALEAIDLLFPGRESHPSAYLGAVMNALPILSNLDRREQILSLIGQALPFAERTHGTSAEVVPKLLAYRGLVQIGLDQLYPGEQDLHRAIELSEKGGEKTRGILSYTSNFLAALLSREGNAVGALQWNRKADSTLPSTAKDAQYNRLMYRVNLASIKTAMGHFSEALEILDDLSHRLPQISGADAQLNTDRIALLTSRCRLHLGDTDAAEKTIRDILTRVGVSAGEDRSHAVAVHIAAARILSEVGRIDDVASELDKAKLAENGAASSSLTQLKIDWLRAEWMIRRGQIADARGLLEKARSRAIAILGGNPSWILGEINDTLGRIAVVEKDLPGAATSFRAAVSQFEDAVGRDSPSALRSEIHALLSMQPPAGKQREGQLAMLRGHLAQSLGTDNTIAVWQLDLLIEKEAGDAAAPALIRRADYARAALAERHATESDMMRGVGISSFD